MEPRTLLSWRLLGAATLAGAFVCAAAAWLGHGNEAHFFLALGTLFFVAGPIAALTCIGMICFSFVSYAGPDTHGPRAFAILINLALASLVVVGGAILSFVPGAWIGQGMERDAMIWAENLAPSIEQHRDRHGVYPTSLDEVVDLSTAPRLVREGELHFRSDADAFSFDLWTGFLSGYEWKSSRGIWCPHD